MDAFLWAATVSPNLSVGLICTVVAMLVFLFIVLDSRKVEKDTRELERKIDDLKSKISNLAQHAGELLALKQRFETEFEDLSEAQKELLWNPVEAAMKEDTGKIDWGKVVECARQAVSQAEKLKSKS